MAESVSYFAVKSIGLSRLNGRKPCTLLQAARHNLREIQAERGASSQIDQQRMRLNQVLIGGDTAAAVQAVALSLAESSGVDLASLRRDHCQAIETVFSLPLTPPIEPIAYFRRCIEWLKDVLPLSILSAVVHYDESNPHMHVLQLPIGRNEYLGSSVIQKKRLKVIRESFFNRVAGPAGLQRESARLRGADKRRAVAAVLHECERKNLPEKIGGLWSVLHMAIEKDPLKALQALGMDVNAIRASRVPSWDQRLKNPIEIESNSIGFGCRGGDSQSLSCVGIEQKERMMPDRKAT